MILMNMSKSAIFAVSNVLNVPSSVGVGACVGCMFLKVIGGGGGRMRVLESFSWEYRKGLGGRNRWCGDGMRMLVFVTVSLGDKCQESRAL